MDPMLPRLVRFAKPADAWLREEANRLGIPVAELIRRIVDESREQPDGQELRNLGNETERK
jgi:hypothetical protein